MGDNDAIIPHDSEAKALSAAMFDKVIIVFSPRSPPNEGIIFPRLSANDSFHEGFDTFQAMGKWTQNGQDGVLAFQGVDTPGVGDTPIRRP